MLHIGASEADYGAAVSPHLDEISQAGAGTRARARAHTKWGNILGSALGFPHGYRACIAARRGAAYEKPPLVNCVGYLPVFSLSVFPRNAVLVGGTGGA